MSPKALQLLTPTGNPNGLKIVTVPGWDGRAYIVPRQSIKELKAQPDNNKPGLYILFGQDETTAEKLAYIGESENFFKRITTHNAKIEFWDTAIIFTGGLNKAYVKYLEHHATLLATDAKRIVTQNKIQPVANSLSDFDKLAVDQFFGHIQFILSSLNYEIFERLEESIINDEAYYLKGVDFDATAKLLDNGSMLLLADSLATTSEAPSYKGWTKDERATLRDVGKFIQVNDKQYRLTENLVVKSPSAAAAIMAGRSINGWTAWKDASGRTLDENLRK